MTLKCFKQNRVDGDVLLRQLQRRGSQVRAETGGLGLGLGRGKTEADQHLAAPGLADRVSRRAAALLGKTSRSKTQGSKNPRGASGELNPASRTLSGCCRQGKDAAVRQPGPQQLARLAATFPEQALQPPLLAPASSALPSPAAPIGRAHEGSHPSLKSGHVLKEPLPLEASCQCIALWSLNTLLARTQAILPNTSHATHAEVVLDMPWLNHPPTMQRHLLDWAQSSPCPTGSDPDPAELSLEAGGSASARNQSLAAPQCQTPLLLGISPASRLPDYPTTAQLGSFKALPGSGTPPLPGEAGDLLGEGTSSIQG